jgi:lipopolysaccharide/colanic/teichoic acid biosynthesis glycosyltransferase
VDLIKKEVPYYDIRHLITPGVTGWAQINYRYGSSIQDSYEKLQYDIYYLKNRSLILDIAVILKTLRTLFVNET